MEAHRDDPPSDDAFASAADRRFARAAAGRVLRDAALAEDAAQDAWLAAWRRDPSGRPARAWLAVAVRSRATDILRERRRRECREEHGARAEAKPGVDETALAAEVRRAVTDATLRLAEPYRTAILLRYFAEEPPREIAARLGVPVATVRTRLARGLRLLRTGVRNVDGARSGRRLDSIAAAPAFGGATGKLLFFALIVAFAGCAEALPFFWNALLRAGLVAER